MSLFHATIITIFPEIFPGSLNFSLSGKALKKGIWSYEVINIRDFGRSKHRKVDDEAFGGGSGLIMRPDVVGGAIEHALDKNPTASVYITSPKGKLFSQRVAREMILEKGIIILCGRFEGIDQRITDEYNAKELSIGDYVLSGGEIAAQVMLDCCIRLLPGVLKNQETIISESFEESGEFLGMLECSQYTRPATWKNRIVPKVLLSGHHQEIKKWRYEKSKELTKLRRPDLISGN